MTWTGATPLMGAPVGMSVFMDGVRVNEPFGDQHTLEMTDTPVALAHADGGAQDQMTAFLSMSRAAQG